MPSSDYLDQHPDALRLTLIEGDLDYSQFRVLAFQELECARIRVRATIIGASHVVTFDTGSFALHEIFACVALPNIASWPIDELIHGSVERQLPGVKYVFSVQQIPWVNPQPFELLELTESARQREEDSIGLVYDFPRGECLITPKTVIHGCTETAERIVIKTAHSYPNVPGLVLSQSVLSYTQEGA